MAVLPGLLLVAVGVALSFTPTTMVIASAAPATHTGLASGLAGSASQVGAALGTATFTAIGIAGRSTGLRSPCCFRLRRRLHRGRRRRARHRGARLHHPPKAALICPRPSARNRRHHRPKTLRPEQIHGWLRTSKRPSQ